MVVLYLQGVPPGSGSSGGPVILELPLDKIRRPLMRTRANDPDKVKELMDSISEIGLQVPVSTCFPFLINYLNFSLFISYRHWVVIELTLGLPFACQS